ncbi:MULTISPECIES: hypothetical protein [unclassified Microcoleus]|uniref:hypothetical protein n=1 Tax=unclassified Microcoleus TaxID=2642155 RepID=UPI0025E12FCD|nr:MULTISPECIES: hypothetical protein [unclassified Microcoleus]
MNIILYPLLGTPSKRALLKETGKWGRPYKYRPRGNLLVRLSKETGMSVEDVKKQLSRERRYFLKSK